MPLLDYSFIEKGNTLKLHCKVLDGWRKHKKTYCFSEAFVFDWNQDRRIRATVSLFPRPSGFSHEADHWSLSTNVNKTAAGVRYSIHKGLLEISVPLTLDMSAFPDLVMLGGPRTPFLPWRQTHDDIFPFPFLD